MFGVIYFNELHLFYFPLISIRYTCCNFCNFFRDNDFDIVYIYLSDGGCGPMRTSLTFDREVTYTPVGVPRDLFSREADFYMWRTIPFDKMGWDKVSQPHREAIMNT
ncbi:hypothetical protein HanRHA438_Chr14g0633591 [Helianthus annuus]|nr:hypothetical protein HanHA89_Chr14g0542441 [Helianthus annuus]KAJ0852036.1 hypothetical protein HanRHA438_Chr14g0633591 [Helianthus annuus]